MLYIIRTSKLYAYAYRQEFIITLDTANCLQEFIQMNNAVYKDLVPSNS